MVLVIHGGAGVLDDLEMKAAGLNREQFEAALTEALAAGYEALQRKDSTSTHGVEAAIRVMEDSPLFNAGHGAALDIDGRASLDASIMEGHMKPPKGDAAQGKMDPRKRAGAVAAVFHIKNPISAARAIMEMKDQRHVLLVGEGAEKVVFTTANKEKYAIEEVSNAYFVTDRRMKQLRDFLKAEKAASEKSGEKGARGKRLPGSADRYFGTVGAVAVKNGTLTAGTSTGGLTGKLRGRVGDSPLIGSGTYADDRACGVSCTGTGEVFIRHAVAHDVVARMLYKTKCSIEQAVKETIRELPDEDGGVGGLIALDPSGRHSFEMSAKCVGMYRGYVTEKGEIHVALFKDKAMKHMTRRD